MKDPAQTSGVPGEGAGANEAMVDADLVARILAGEAACFVELMRRNNRRLYRAVRAILRNDAEAEDVLQDTYVRAYAHLRALEDHRHVRTWLTRIAVHEALARRRRDRRLLHVEAPEEAVPMDSRSQSSSAPPDATATAGELRTLLEDAIDRLAEPYRVVFVLRAVEELSVAETAQSLDLTEQAVKTRFFRARDQLRRLLTDRIEAQARNAYEFAGARCEGVVHRVMQSLALTPGENEP